MPAAANRWWWAIVLVASVATAALAGDLAQTGGSQRSWPSRAVGDTHNCDGFYPDAARRTNQSGNVMIGYDVSADGSITHVAVLKSSGYPVLDLAALQCVSTQWRNLPAMKNGRPVASPGHRVLVQFALRGTVAPAPTKRVAKTAAAESQDASLPIVLILSGLGAMGLAGFLARIVTRPRVSA
jgi:TonB family protein